MLAQTQIVYSYDFIRKLASPVMLRRTLRNQLNLQYQVTRPQCPPSRKTALGQRRTSRVE